MVTYRSELRPRTPRVTRWLSRISLSSNVIDCVRADWVPTRKHWGKVWLGERVVQRGWGQRHDHGRQCRSGHYAAQGGCRFFKKLSLAVFQHSHVSLSLTILISFFLAFSFDLERFSLIVVDIHAKVSQTSLVFFSCDRVKTGVSHTERRRPRRRWGCGCCCWRATTLVSSSLFLSPNKERSSIWTDGGVDENSQSSHCLIPKWNLFFFFFLSTYKCESWWERERKERVRGNYKSERESKQVSEPGRQTGRERERERGDVKEVEHLH